MGFAKTLELLKNAEIVGDGGKQRELVIAAIRELSNEFKSSDGAAGTSPHHTLQHLIETIS